MKNQLLMVICKYPKVGNVKTRLAKSTGAVLATDICRAMLLDLLGNHRNQTYNIIIETNENKEDFEHFRKLVPEFSIRKNQGDDLRGSHSVLWNAFKHHFPKYHKMIAIYADTPFLNSRIVIEGFGYLEKVDVVVGPSVEAGYYLIGMRKATDLFTSLKKGRHPNYYEETIDLIRKMKLSYRTLTHLRDIDTIYDIKAINWESIDEGWLRTKELILKSGLLRG